MDGTRDLESELCTFQLVLGIWWVPVSECCGANSVSAYCLGWGLVPSMVHSGNVTVFGTPLPPFY